MTGPWPRVNLRAGGSAGGGRELLDQSWGSPPPGFQRCSWLPEVLRAITPILSPGLSVRSVGVPRWEEARRLAALALRRLPLPPTLLHTFD